MLEEALQVAELHLLRVYDVGLLLHNVAAITDILPPHGLHNSGERETEETACFFFKPCPKRRRRLPRYRAENKALVARLMMCSDPTESTRYTPRCPLLPLDPRAEPPHPENRLERNCHGCNSASMFKLNASRYLAVL